MGEITNEHRIGDLSARVQLLESYHLRLEARIDNQLKDMREMIGDMHEVVTTAKGSWRTLVILGGIFTAISTAFAATLHWWFGR